MITDQLLVLHDELEAKATPRPWITNIKKKPGYRDAWWSRTGFKETPWNSEPDAIYLTLLRNIAPDLVDEVRKLRKMCDQLSSIVIEQQVEIAKLEKG
jgi:hypothetical protein